MKYLPLATLLVCVAASESYAQTTNDRDAESKIMALERVGKLQACEAKELKTLDAILDDAFVFVNQDGRPLTKTDVLAYVQTAGSIQYQMEQMIVKVHGDTVIVTGLYHVKGIMRGEIFKQQGRFVDTWVFKNARWVAVASISTPEM